MKVIDLLNKIANGEEVPKKIKWFDKWLEKESTYIFDEENKDYVHIGYIEYLFNDNFMTESLNDEVEIIEEDKEIKKIEKLENKIDSSFENANYSEIMRLTEIVNKLNELIDEVNKLKKDYEVSE